MDYRNILATGFLLLCGAVFVQSLKSANAFPQGPNVSMGSNPIESIHGTITTSNTGNNTIYTNTSGLDFIVTNLNVPNAYYCLSKMNGNILNYMTTGHNTYEMTFNTPINLVMHDGDYLQIQKQNPNINCMYYISGYYVQP